MVSPELQKQFAQHGVVIVPRSVGRKSLDQELRWGRKGRSKSCSGVSRLGACNAAGAHAMLSQENGPSPHPALVRACHGWQTAQLK